MNNYFHKQGIDPTQNNDKDDGNHDALIMRNPKIGLMRLIKKNDAMEKRSLMYHTYENPLQYYFHKYGINPTITNRYDANDEIFFELVNPKNPMESPYTTGANLEKILEPAITNFWRTENTNRLV